MTDLRSILAEIDTKVAAQTTLAAYAEYAMETVPARHHQIICEHIDSLLNDDFDELIILAPPGSAKSTYTSIGLSAYFMGRYPKGHILTCSYSTELAEKWGRRVRNQITSPAHVALFPECQLSKDSQSAGRWATTLNGEFYAAGVGSGILGFRADLAVIDDPISGFEQAQSTTQLAKVHNWYETDFITRMKPKGKLVLICQRLARNDLAGYLIDRNQATPTRRQRILTLKMECEDSDTDPLHRLPGERLWPEWFTEAMVTDAKRDEYKWKTLYQQSPPSDTGEWVTPDEMQLVDLVPANLKHYVLSDIALSINTGDYSVHLVVGVDETHNLYVVDAWRERCDTNRTAEQHVTLCETYSPVMECLIDDDNASKVYVQLLARVSRERGVSVPYRPMPMRGQDKETRAAPLRGWFKRRKVFLKRAQWSKWLVHELMTFPNAIGDGVDDGVDALSLIGRRLIALAAPAAEQAPKPKMKTIQDATLNDLWEERESRGKFNQRRL